MPNSVNSHVDIPDKWNLPAFRMKLILCIGLMSTAMNYTNPMLVSSVLAKQEYHLQWL